MKTQKQTSAKAIAISLTKDIRAQVLAASLFLFAAAAAAL